MKLTQEQDALSGAFVRVAEPFYVRTFDMDFADALRGFREIEADFMSRAAGDAFVTLELQRRIAEFVVRLVRDHRQPIDTCRSAWLDLVRLGFSSTSVHASMTRYFAECCLFNHEFTEGIATLEPFIAEFEQRLRDAPSLQRAEHYRYELDIIGVELHKLKSESRRCADPLILEVARAIDKLSTDMAEADFPEYHAALDKLENDFVARAGDDEARIREIKWRTTYHLFDALPDEVTFESCQACFDELARLGFDDLQRQCDATWIYARKCRSYDQFEAGHAVVDPLIADLRKRLEEPSVTEEMARLCRFQLDRLEGVLEKRK